MNPTRFRLAVCYATIAACVPYLTLKIAWLAGSTVGWNDLEAAKDSTLYVGNAITMGMDAIAVVVALAFTYPWGRRIPAWIVAAPIWIATGLLAPIVLGVPFGVLLQFLSGQAQQSGQGGEGLQGWVYAVVYTGFTLQGLGLLTAFVFYARDRWGRLFRLRTADLPNGPGLAIQRFLTLGAIAPAAVYASVHLYWAFGGESETVTQHTVDAVWGLLSLAGVAGLLALVRRAKRPGPVWIPLTAAWTGAGATFAWSFYMGLVTLAKPAAFDTHTSAAEAMTMVCGVFAGLIMAVAGTLFLRETMGGRARATGQIASPMASSTP
ncbi:hypothetical protein J4573_06200 [Actinomadura barringtoniae]|uniref:Aromatic ring-opening dioxygenase LigA n=1 Tax=Actinomadura barringtoniae TaxID=1427535 RepID=A0A939P710_9ACTN|nr:hypothetical protein [Actinomadura barringtoniae]MBO2446675.1 hypothetical protein [Actinomadura barringtoniae]